jgi:hypothetical protein
MAMDLRNQLLNDASKRNIHYICSAIHKKPEITESVIECIREDTHPLSSRGAWVFSTLSEKNHFFNDTLLEEMIELLFSSSLESVKRNLLKTLTRSDIPDKHQGKVLDFCFSKVEDSSSAIAIRIYSLQILFNLSKLYPDLTNEINVVANELYLNENKALKARAKQILNSKTND